MREIEKAGKNYILIFNIKKYSQLNIVGYYSDNTTMKGYSKLRNPFGRRDNNDMILYINELLSKGVYYRKDSKSLSDVEYFYNHWVGSKYYYTEDLKG